MRINHFTSKGELLARFPDFFKSAEIHLTEQIGIFLYIHCFSCQNSLLIIPMLFIMVDFAKNKKKIRNLIKNKPKVKIM